jgi:hypothetical protein|tara:strand:+ start:2898 stop:3254 length:357 start_codon:yes stop_codon:yes gene_type:complete
MRRVPRYLGAERKDWCSRWPDVIEVAGEKRYYGDCCRKHDWRYATPGDRFDRARADRELRDCVTARAGKWWGRLMYWGVRLAGWPPWHYNRTIFMRRLDDDEREELAARFNLGGDADH